MNKMNNSEKFLFASIGLSAFLIALGIWINEYITVPSMFAYATGLMFARWWGQ